MNKLSDRIRKHQFGGNMVGITESELENWAIEAGRLERLVETYEDAFHSIKNTVQKVAPNKSKTLAAIAKSD